MMQLTLQDSDWELIDLAKALIQKRAKTDWHAVSAVLRTQSGEIHYGLHLEAYVGRIAVCAEAIAIGNAAIAGDTQIDTIVAVYKTGDIVAPCGMCRELIADYAPNARVILHDKQNAFKVDIQSLLPMKYQRE